MTNCTTCVQVEPSLTGHVLAEDINAPHQIPLTPTTNVDGYAIDGPSSLLLPFSFLLTAFPLTLVRCP